MKSFLETLRKLWADPMGKIGMIGVFLLIAMAIFAPMLAPYPYDQIGMRFQPPSGEHIFGTDEFGRDIFSRVLYGARVSIQVGVIAVSGLPHLDDHQVIVETLTEWFGRKKR